MKATSKLRPPHPSAERPLQGVRGSFLSVNCSHAELHHQMFHISPVLRCFRKCAKMRTFESERDIEAHGLFPDPALRANVRARAPVYRVSLPAC